MPVDVIMPQMGESIFEGTVTKWLKKPGDKVQRDEPLFEISTDKVDAEIPAPVAGVLKEIKISEGKTVQVNTVVAVIDAEGVAAAPPAPVPPPAAAASAPPRTPAPSPQALTAPAAVATAPPPPAPPASGAERVRSSPLVRRLAEENHVDLGQIAGTGEGGRVSKRDISQHLEQRGVPAPAQAAAPWPTPPATAAPAAASLAPSAAAAPVPRPAATAPAPYLPGATEIVPMSVMRKRIAEHMVVSKRTSPHVYSVFQADLTQIAALRERSKQQFEAATGTRLTFMPFFAQATAECLKQFPIVNSSVQEDSIVYKKDINVGIAVALDWGLIVPVVKHAEEKNFLGLQRAINDLAERARGKRLAPEEVQDGTFTITNPGIYGGLFGMPVINQPQVAILGVGGIHKTPVVVNDAIAIRSIVHLTLSFDHRVIDGAVADQFLAALCHKLEHWTQPLL